MKIKALIFGVMLLSSVWGSALARANVTSSYQPLESALLPLWASEPNGLTPLGAASLVVGGKTLGTVVAYDDANTERAADYLELYDNEGHLVAVGWYDRFGIERVAIDRGLLEQKEDLEGVFVVFLAGEAV